MSSTETQFKKGQSGNPGGRPKVLGEVRELARQHTEAAIAMLANIMADTEQPPAARVAAAREILDRGYGKATQPISGDDDGGPARIIVSWLGSESNESDDAE